MRSTRTPAAHHRWAAGETGSAVLLVERCGRRYGLELACVTEICAASASAQVSDAGARAIRDRNGVRVPILSLAEPAGAQSSHDADALVVLALADRMAAVAVDAVCEVRIAHTRSSVPLQPGGSLAQSIGWIAAWDGAEVPVIDVAAWLQANEVVTLAPATA